jgi:hypothetical protein
MTQLAIVNGDARYVVNPDTGDVLDLSTAATEDLAAARDALTELGKQRNNAIGELDAEIVRRTDAAISSGELAEYTFRVGGFKVEVQSPAAGRKYDASGLRSELMDRAERGEIDLSPSAVEGAFVARTYWYLRVARWNTLARLHPALAQLRDTFSEPSHRTVKVSPEGPVRAAAIEATAQED